jgi:tRNA(His) 5'-end guanylyltransferase
MFNRLEKIDSLLPSFFTSIFSTPDSTACFDCRIVPVTNSVDATNYLVWRQLECGRNFLNGWAEQILIKSENLNPSRASKVLKGLGGEELKKLCLSKGVNLDLAPKWQQNGITLYIKTYFKNGYNPITKESVLAKRQYVKEDWEIPKFGSTEGKEYINFLLSTT